MSFNHQFQTNYAIGAYAAHRDLWDTPIFESHSFVALPTVGALVEGWLLVVPRKPLLSFAQLPEPLFPELQTFLREVADAIQSTYGSVSLFEHGPACLASSVGCGVDYAHLHLAPVQCELLKGAKKIAPNVNWQKVASLKDVRHYTSAGYWFLQQDFGSSHCYIGTCAYGEPTSQLFRRVIVEHLGLPASSYDWKLDLGKNKIAATVDRLTNLLSIA